ncbi:hypothetical protein SEA_REFUGE_9 [Mycobacterium phage Refuge]|uniref:Uncharacterized protein n=1 Tax=Mycobacterium phage Refuge TaxID=2517967 RepID=A0A482JHI0_9CAUD|nr:hypothetical protein KIV61_gp09 [Mycobacterium phage Refuge]QBP31032.1 hypothetical protein SEA_REFUGE_9 [Mycobacterium phage Refuge]
MSRMMLRKVNSKKLYTDNFDRASLGSDWLLFTALNPYVPLINTNAFYPGDDATYNSQAHQRGLWAQPVATNDHAVRATIALRAPNGLNSGLIVRSTSDNLNKVELQLNNGGATLYSFVNGAQTSRASVAITGLAQNVVVELRVVGNVYQIVRDPDGAAAVLGTWTDSTNLFPPDPSRRYGGLYVVSDQNVFSQRNWSNGWDNFQLRDL